MSTNYSAVESKLAIPTGADGPTGSLSYILKLLARYDTSAALVSGNPLADVAAKLAAVDDGSPFYREVQAVLTDALDRQSQGR